jgi:site-specific DNA-methyltransferase (adenine-specific)
MIIFCSFEQQFPLIELARKYEINNYLNLVFRKDFSAQVLKANMRVVGNAEYGLILYRDKLPKFNNNGKMIFNVMDWEKDTNDIFYEKIHPTQKPVKLLEKLINIFTDPGDVVIDPVAGSGSTLIAATNTGRKGYGFEIKKDFFKAASSWIDKNEKAKSEIKELGYSPTLLNLKKNQYNLFDGVSNTTFKLKE